MSIQHLQDIFMAGVNAVKPSEFIPRNLVCNGNVLRAGENTFNLQNRKVYIAAAGKAAAAMAQETEKILRNKISEGIVVTKYQHALPLQICKTIEAAHPVPDERSVEGGKAILELFSKTQEEDIIILLVSGGASALLCDLPPGCTLADLQRTSTLLLDCGAAIDEINTIRKHLSQIKGGQLMQRTTATVIALILSDVPGDDLSVIASGLTVPDKTSFADAWQVIEKYALQEKLTKPVSDWLSRGKAGYLPDTPGNDDPAFKNVFNILVATNGIALEAAQKKASAIGYITDIVQPPLSGEADERAASFVKKMIAIQGDEPRCLLWGGETTVTIKGTGTGGRNQQFALAALCAMKEMQGEQKAIHLLSGGTDGTDGPTNATGAFANYPLIEKANSFGLDPKSFLANNDAYTFFQQVDGLIITGPTQTNVMDLVVGISTGSNEL
ncbi:MAG: glycerate kinase type-2 family protein [Agriterribacter sp.]